MKAFAIRRGEGYGELVGRILCQDIRPAFRKGHVLRAEDIPVLIAASWTELHLLEPGPDDVPQREAGEHLAQILASAGLRIAAAGHRHVLRAERNGIVKLSVTSNVRWSSVLPCDDASVPITKLTVPAWPSERGMPRTVTCG